MTSTNYDFVVVGGRFCRKKVCTALALKFVYALYLTLTTLVYYLRSTISDSNRKISASQRDAITYP